ncbi:MAG: N-acetylglucosamine-6-phosphate deacetylase [Thermosediminibacterales bacterium]|nr:N-acetylglucosamine-6-phosphate deacetylase [Thermosediminibacterales bacterium]MDK2836920.1 N-acetylglucosamine-6-phosphate deacetylase [Thermosediminibacterales bacterium]
MANIKAIVEGTIVTPFQILKDGVVIFENNKIIAVGTKKEISLPAGIKLINASDKFVVPGFIDLHVHGGGGYDTMDGSYEAIQKIAAAHARFGTTALLPTAITDSSERIIQSIEAVNEAIQRGTGTCQILGVHLEGPFINPG